MVGIVKVSSKPVKGKRKFASAEKAKQARELEENWARINKVHKPLIVTLGKVKVSRGPVMVGRDTGPAPGVRVNTGLCALVLPKREVVEAPHLRYSGKMLERERQAQKETEVKKKQVAPLANKMGYQYITDPADFKTMGRKV